MIRLKKILCPIDFSACSTYVLTYAIDLSLKYHASLYLLHVVETYMGDIGDILKQIDLLLDDKQTDSFKMRLIDLIPAEIRTNIHIDTLVVKGTPFVEIIKASKDNQIDLIVMGTHGKVYPIV